MSLRVGKHRRRVTIETPVETRDARGQPIVTWTEYAKRWASFQPGAGREFFQGHTDVAETGYRIGIRYDATVAAVTPKMRVKMGARVFDIQHSPINVQERNQELILVVKERET